MRPGDLPFDLPLEGHGGIHIIHRAGEIQPAVAAPQLPVLSDAVAVGHPVAEQRGRNLDRRTKRLRFVMDEFHQRRDVVATELQPFVFQRIRTRVSRPVFNLLAYALLKARAAAVAEATGAVGIADIVEMDAIQIRIIPNKFQHGVRLLAAVQRIRRAEPRVLLFAVEQHLRPFFGFHLLHKRLVQMAAHVPIDLPDMAFHAVLLAGVQTLADLVALFRVIRIRRQNIALVIGHATPKHVRKNRIETVVHQELDGFVPIVSGQSERAMAPEAALFAHHGLHLTAQRLNHLVLRIFAKFDALHPTRLR